MISAFSQMLILCSLAFLAVIGFLFYRRQNKEGEMGGQIAVPKMFWLVYVIFLWFLLCPILSMEKSIHSSIRQLLAMVSVLMWLRGIAEMIMMYLFKNWRPPYGIAHDILCFLLLGGGMIWYWGDWTVLSALDSWMLLLLFVLQLSFALETCYAIVFYRIVGEHTTGDDGLWFAGKGNPQFDRVVQITALWNIPLYIFLLAFLLFPVFGCF